MGRAVGEVALRPGILEAGQPEEALPLPVQRRRELRLPDRGAGGPLRLPPGADGEQPPVGEGQRWRRPRRGIESASPA